MKKIGILYGPEKGSVGKVANIIAKELGEDKAELVLVKDSGGQIIDRFDRIIFGISTLGRTNWDSEHEDDDWDGFFTHLKEAHWEGKQVAIYGLGDQINYPDHFVDAMGWLNEKLKKFNVKVVGFCEDEGYQYNDSEALENGKFVGLPLDEDNEAEKTLGRVQAWLKMLHEAYGF
ncbi:flavodoxin [Labilibacter sediminis]|nr:flavodoxin [Labilibacter sediminis]